MQAPVYFFDTLKFRKKSLCAKNGGWPCGHPPCGIGFGFVKECALNQFAKYSIAAVLYQYSAFAVSFRSLLPLSSAFAMYSPAFAVTV